MKKIVALVLMACMVFALAACGDKDEAKNEGPFVVNACIASEPETIDPGLASSIDASTYTLHQFEGLMKYKMNGNTVDESGNVIDTEVVEGQAASYEVSDDLKTYTFKLRDDIFWSDGEPVKADDFVYSWQRLVDPKNAADYGYFLDGIVLNAAAIQAKEKKVTELGIKALDEKTLEITLESPCPYFLEICAFASLVPLRKDVIEEKGKNWTDPENIVVNGAYKLTEWVHDSCLKFAPNEKYYDVANLGPSEINFWLSKDQTAIISAYQTGEWDYVESFPTDMTATLQSSGDCFIDPYVGTYFLYINCDKVKDWRVRAAMALCVDRENLVTNATQAGEVPAKGLVAAGILDSKGEDFAANTPGIGAIYNQLQDKYPDYDLSSYEDCCELAKKLYKEAVDDGKWNPKTTLVYNFNTDDKHKAIAEACGQDWKTVLGLNITLANQEWNTYTAGLGEHTFGLARMGWIADYNDPITYLEIMATGNSYNYGLYTNKDLDKMINEAKAMPAGEDRDKKLHDAETAIFSEGGFPLIPLYYYTLPYCNKKIGNIGYTKMGYHFFQYAKPAK